VQVYTNLCASIPNAGGEAFNVSRSQPCRKLQHCHNLWSPNFALELTRGPFAGPRKVNCMAARRLHLASSGWAVGRGSRRAAGGRRECPRAAQRGALDALARESPKNSRLTIASVPKGPRRSPFRFSNAKGTSPDPAELAPFFAATLPVYGRRYFICNQETYQRRSADSPKLVSLKSQMAKRSVPGLPVAVRVTGWRGM
jgi:hypothetical protein